MSEIIWQRPLGNQATALGSPASFLTLLGSSLYIADRQAIRVHNDRKIILAQGLEAQTESMTVGAQ